MAWMRKRAVHAVPAGLREGLSMPFRRVCVRDCQCRSARPTGEEAAGGQKAGQAAGIAGACPEDLGAQKGRRFGQGMGLSLEYSKEGAKRMNKVALITGITGQDGSYLAELLLEKGYEVHGIIRRASLPNTARIEHLMGAENLTLHEGDLSDSSSLIRIINIVRPDEIYNLAAQSHVQVSFDVPEYSGDVDAIGVLRILEAVRILGLIEKTKVYQASTSELYGKVEEVPQSESTPFHPYSPYAVAKQYGFWIVREYREAYGMFAANGILFNHESERRGENFVTRKITRAAGRIAEGIQDHLELGNLDSKRDWGYARDYVECMWLMLQQEKPEDFVIATGVQHTVRDFTEKAFAANGLSVRWEGSGLEEKGYDAATGKLLVCVNPQWFRPTDVDNLLGDPTKARTVLGWNPQATSYERLIEIMAEHDRALARRERAVLEATKQMEAKG